MNLLNNEKIIKQGKANFIKSRVNTLGGTLCLTNYRLIFEAHGFNFGGKTVIDLNLGQLTRCQSGKISLMSGQIEVFDKYQNIYTFSVFDRKTWADTIEQEIIQYRNSHQENIRNINNTTILKQSDSLDKIKKLKDLYDAGVITEEEFNNKKAKLLDEL